MQRSKTIPVVSRPLEEPERSPEEKMLQRIATQAVREACEVRRGRLTPRAILAYQWLTDGASAQELGSVGWVCRELGWNLDYWRKKSLEFVHKSWRRTAWEFFKDDLEARSRQVRALAHGGAGDGYLPLVEQQYWHEIADVELPDPVLPEPVLEFE